MCLGVCHFGGRFVLGTGLRSDHMSRECPAPRMNGNQFQGGQDRRTERDTLSGTSPQPSPLLHPPYSRPASRPVSVL